MASKFENFTISRAREAVDERDRLREVNADLLAALKELERMTHDTSVLMAKPIGNMLRTAIVKAEGK